MGSVGPAPQNWRTCQVCGKMMHPYETCSHPEAFRPKQRRASVVSQPTATRLGGEGQRPSYATCRSLEVTCPQCQRDYIADITFETTRTGYWRARFICRFCNETALLLQLEGSNGDEISVHLIKYDGDINTDRISPGYRGPRPLWAKQRPSSAVGRLMQWVTRAEPERRPRVRTIDSRPATFYDLEFDCPRCGASLLLDANFRQTQFRNWRTHIVCNTCDQCVALQLEGAYGAQIAIHAIERPTGPRNESRTVVPHGYQGPRPQWAAEIRPAPQQASELADLPDEAQLLPQESNSVLQWRPVQMPLEFGPLQLLDGGLFKLAGGPTFRNCKINRMHLGQGVMLDAEGSQVCMTIPEELGRPAGVRPGQHRFRFTDGRWEYAV